MKDVTKISKSLSYILRHKPEKWGITLDENGWADVSQILEKLETSNDLLLEVVETNNKKRFAFNEDKTKIRANQGHTIKVDVQLKRTVPLFDLYHGTKVQFLDSIKKQGLKSMKRQHVHLSKDLSTATNVAGRRNGNNVILTIDTKAMLADGKEIFISENGVYLTETVEPKYIKYEH